MRYSCFSLLIILLSACSQTEKPVAHTPSSSTTIEAKKSPYEEGQELFLTNCASCHTVKKPLTGPALAGAAERWADKELLHEWIRNSQAVIKKDKYANDLYIKWNKSIMTPFPFLTDDQINSILSYIDTEAKK